MLLSSPRQVKLSETQILMITKESFDWSEDFVKNSAGHLENNSSHLVKIIFH